MSRNTIRTGKQSRPKTAVKGKRYLCATCRKRSPRPVLTPAPWYCPKCQAAAAASLAAISAVELSTVQGTVEEAASFQND